MTVFSTIAETRQLGAPVVALFRTALGRDPDAHELARFAPAVRDRTPLPTLAADLVATPEFRRRHVGPDRQALLATLCRNAFGAQVPPAATLAGALAASEAECVAAIAGAALAQARIPLLPGLAPGAAPDDRVAYRLWVDEYDTPDPAALAALPPLAGPPVHIAMAAGDTEAEAVLRTVASLRAQAYPDWTLHLAARTLSPWSHDTIAALPGQDPRVRLLPGGTHAEALAHAIAEAQSLVGLLAPGDRLPPSALHEVAAAFAAHPDARMLFTDEDVEDEGGRHSPRFKPGFSPDALLDGDAIGQLAVYRADLLASLGPLPASPDTPRALALRAARALRPHQVLHLPAVLCHRGRPPAPLDLAAPRSAASATAQPPVTLLVPTKDRAELLQACLGGVLDRTDYPSLAVSVIDNGSTDPDALRLLDELDRHPRVRVLRRPGRFNFAALNNAAAREAEPGLLLLLNNDTEILHPGWLAEMAAHAVRPGVGIVGARLLYPAGTIQHAGILLGPGAAATHVGRGASPTDPGYLGQLASVRDLSAVTAACLAISTATWHQVGGMDERLAVTWNDIDLCLRVRDAGLRVLWTPHATLLHRESISRGLESEDPDRVRRFEAEQALVAARWGDALEREPFLNPNLLALESGALALARPRARRPFAVAPFAWSA